jgi:lipopolysaccharide biosynthesis glycosyltransferase
MKNVIFIPNVATGDGRSTPYHYSVKSWKHWAEKHNVLVLEWDEPIMDTSKFPIIMQREWVFDILEHNDIDYDQILIVDADTIVHPDCPNFFKETNHNYAAVVNNGCYEWVTRSVRGWGDAMFPNEPLVKPYDYFNTGFVVVNKKHKPFFDEIKDLYLNRGEEIKHYRDTIKASTGQTMVNFMLKKNNIEVTKLSEGYNLQDLFRKNLLHIPGHSWFSDDLHFLDAGWVYHFNAIPQNPRDVSYWMERTYNKLYK